MSRFQRVQVMPISNLSELGTISSIIDANNTFEDIRVFPIPVQEHLNITYSLKQAYKHVSIVAVKCSILLMENITFDQTENDLLKLMDVLSYNYRQYKGIVNSDCRCVQILRPFKGFRFLFSTRELKELGEILNQSYLLYEAERIMNSEN